jgi:uncharacterized protein (DUF305 family)
MTTVREPAMHIPPPEAGEPEDDGDGERPDRRPSWFQIVVLAVACAFAGGAATYWWQQRPARPNAADVGFYDDMTPHHEQGIDIALTYLRYGENRLLRHMADEVVWFQVGDIRLMQAALSDWDKNPNDSVAMAWMGTPVPEDRQPGMATPAQLRSLAAARGENLDDLFSRLMINHHAGGIHMASAEARLGRDDDARTFATKMANAQRTEIQELNFARKQLGLPPVDPAID